MLNKGHTNVQRNGSAQLAVQTLTKKL